MRKERAKKFLDLVKQGHSYKEIGAMFNLSKSMVYLELRKFHKDEIRQALNKRGFVGIGERNTAKDFITIECKNCKKTKETNNRYYKQKFCSRECLKEYYKKIWQET